MEYRLIILDVDKNDITNGKFIIVKEQCELCGLIKDLIEELEDDDISIPIPSEYSIETLELVWKYMIIPLFSPDLSNLEWDKIINLANYLSFHHLIDIAAKKIVTFIGKENKDILMKYCNDIRGKIILNMDMKLLFNFSTDDKEFVSSYSNVAEDYSENLIFEEMTIEQLLFIKYPEQYAKFREFSGRCGIMKFIENFNLNGILRIFRKINLDSRWILFNLTGDFLGYILKTQVSDCFKLTCPPWKLREINHISS